MKIEAIRSRFAEGWSNYVEVDEGWYELVIACHEDLKKLDPDYKVSQIKEKFGSLRYYFQPSEACDRLTFYKMKEVTDGYEKLSSETCEATGKPGVLMRSETGWYKTLNPEYAKTSLVHSKYEVCDRTKRID